MKEITIQVPDGKKAEWVDGVLTLVDETPKDNRPVTERIKTFEDAYRELGEDHQLVYAYKELLSIATREDYLIEVFGYDMVSYLKLRIIAAALNEGWEPQFTEDECRWYPWFTLWTEEELKDKTEEWKEEHSLWLFGGASSSGSSCGLASSYSLSAWSYSRASISARLAVKSKELAVYFGKQFIEIWADYVLIKK